MNSHLLYYDSLAQFNYLLYKNLLTKDNLCGGQIHIKSLTYPDKETDDEAHFWGYELQKDGIRYLLPSVDNKGNEINIQQTLPLLPEQIIKVANKGNVYKQITKYKKANFKAKNTMTFKQLINELSSLSYSHSKHKTLMWFIALTQVIDRANFRISSPPGFGKDSTVDILGNLVGDCATVENPTLAKLEYMTAYKWLAINEIVDVAKTEWRNIEQFLLSTGAFKPEITKHSRAMSSGVTEIIDISNFSVSLLYNDIDCYPITDKYVDFVTKKAVLDRFPALRLYGQFTEDFNSIKNVDIPTLVSNNMDKYKELIYNLVYFKLNKNKLQHGWKVNDLKKMPERWQTNIHRLLSTVDLYCDTQEEFNDWVVTINNAMNDYDEMLKYPNLVEQVMKKLSDKDFKLAIDTVRKLVTFTARNRQLSKYLKEGFSNYEETTIDNFWRS